MSDKECVNWDMGNKNIGEVALAGFEHSSDEKMNYKIAVLDY